jgi:hypothetical protein
MLPDILRAALIGYEARMQYLDGRIAAIQSLLLEPCRRKAPGGRNVRLRLTRLTKPKPKSPVKSEIGTPRETPKPSDSRPAASPADPAPPSPLDRITGHTAAAAGGHAASPHIVTPAVRRVRIHTALKQAGKPLDPIRLATHLRQEGDQTADAGIVRCALAQMQRAGEVRPAAGGWVLA